jgi:hypothetical protein
MKAKLVKLLDKNGAEYIGLEIEENMDKYNNFLTKELENAQNFIEQKMQRDSGKYHITVLSVPQMQSFKKKNPDEYEKFLHDYLHTDFNITMSGIGTAIDAKKGNQAWFIVTEVQELQNILEKFGFPPKDFHITLAFHQGDVFSQPKGKDSIIYKLEKINQYQSQMNIGEIRENALLSNTNVQNKRMNNEQQCR